ncbi:MAG: T9SS type A sorting domain-containing protein, partial [Flavobacteriales bacterium]|nr:T9SS type A sorting domain-containing protein [Flavobacteriales bacterium]
SVASTFESINLNNEPVTVVFQVDMSAEEISPAGVHLAGDFQGWNPNGTLMTELGGGIYEQSFQIEAGSIIHFKFINGSEWVNAESVPVECGTDDGGGNINRSIAVGTESFIYGPVCFGACDNNCAPPALVDVLIQVDMTGQTVAPEGVHVAGTFQNWDPGATPMSDAGGGIWQYTVSVEENKSHAYKFINGIDWPNEETVPSECGTDDGFGGFNRTFTVSDSDLALDPVCFGECTACQPDIPVFLFLRVDMQNEIISDQGVYVVGDFNAWDTLATQMSEYAPGKYEAVAVVYPGDEIQYKFLNGPSFSGEESVPSECGVSNGFGGYNRGVVIPAENITMEEVCFGTCEACVAIDFVQVTLQVDMLNEVVNAAGVFVAGSFNGFSPSDDQMEEVLPGVYQSAVQVPANSQLTWKFLNGPDWAFVETVPFECGTDDGFGGYNRYLDLNDADVVTPPVCFSSCEICPTGISEDRTEGMAVWPNPTRDRLYFQGKAGEEWTLYDITGQRVAKGKSEGGTSDIDLTTHSTGIYLFVCERFTARIEKL